MEETNSILKFIDEVFTLAGYNKLPDEVREQYREKFGDELQKRLGIMALRQLKKEDIADFSKLASESPSDFEKVIVFFSERISNFQEKMSEELEQFAKDFIETARKMNEVDVES